jgi:hypothetical protein
MRYSRSALRKAGTESNGMRATSLWQAEVSGAGEKSHHNRRLLPTRMQIQVKG